jgi:phosphoribosylformylglycinamidine cyclo-ligase
MRPHVSYLPDVLPLVDRDLIRGMAHITGGGLVDNVPRMLPDAVAVEIDPTTWETPPIFAYLAGMGDVPTAEMYRVFNMGIGFVLAVRPDDAPAILAELAGGRIIGEVVARRDERQVRGLF